MSRYRLFHAGNELALTIAHLSMARTMARELASAGFPTEVRLMDGTLLESFA